MGVTRRVPIAVVAILAAAVPATAAAPTAASHPARGAAGGAPTAPAGGVALVRAAARPRVIPPERGRIAGRTYGGWSAGWGREALPIPARQNPPPEARPANRGLRDRPARLP